MVGSLEAFDALLTHGRVGIAFMDRDLRFVRVNEALCAMSGRPASDYLGLRLEEVHGRPDVDAVVRQVLESGEPAPGLVIEGHRADGRPLVADVTYFPVHGPDGIEGVGCVTRDLTASVAAARQRDTVVERITRLQQVTGSLAMARTIEEVAGVVLDDVRRAVGADGAALCTVSDHVLDVVAATGMPPDSVTRWRSGGLGSVDAVIECVRTGRMAVGRDEVELVALPLVLGGEVQGTLAFGFITPPLLDTDLEVFLLSLAQQCSQALLRANLTRSELDARADTEAAASRLAYLAEATAALAASLDWEPTLRRITELAVPRLADLAAVFVVEGDAVTALEVAHQNPARRAAILELDRRWPTKLDEDFGLGAVARTGRSIIVPELHAALGRPGDLGRARAEALAGAGIRSLIAVPLPANERIAGVVLLGTEGARTLGADELALATELATRAGQAIVNAELFRDRSHVAATLQASLLPPSVATVPGLDVATRFHAVGAGIEVGGDFYDVVPLGRPTDEPNGWAIVIGDVRGKGVEAATVSGAARHALRATALRERSPGAMLRELNDHLLVLAAGAEEPRFCTAAVVVVEPDDAGASVRIAVGGHPPPYVLRATGDTAPVEPAGPLVGVLPDAQFDEAELRLEPGDAIVLYTDGVTERHTGGRFFDEEGLAAVLSRCVGFTSAVLAERIETASRAFVEDAPRDDMAIVVARVPERTATLTTTSTELPADARAPAMAHRFVVATLNALGVVTVVEQATLLAAELVTHALEHGAPPLRVAVETTAEGVRVAVSDGTPGDLPGEGLELMTSMARRWGATPTPSGKTVWFELDG